MTDATTSYHGNDDKIALLSNVALLYYGEGMTQGEVAKRMGVSRATIVNMLREGRESGIVEIRVDGRHLKESTLARTLRETFGLQDVYIAQTAGADADRAAGADADRAAMLRHVGRVAAMAFLDVVSPGDRIGVAWGETILAVSDMLPRVSVKGAEVNQLIGSMISSRVPASEYCAIQIASRIGATCHTLHAPAIVANAGLAATFRAEPTIRAQLDRLKALDMVLYSIGNMAPNTHFAAAGMACETELEAARAAGAAGILCCRYIDAEGRACPLPPEDRLIAADLSMLGQAGKKLLVVCGRDRAGATRAAIRGGLVTHLVVDTALARALLEGAA